MWFETYKHALTRFANFRDRAGREEYWTFFLVNLVAMTALIPLHIVSVMFALVMFVPHIAVAMRRLHDTGRGGEYLFIGLIPFVGPPILWFFLAKDSEDEVNKYGRAAVLPPHLCTQSDRVDSRVLPGASELDQG